MAGSSQALEAIVAGVDDVSLAYKREIYPLMGTVFEKWVFRYGLIEWRESVAAGIGQPVVPVVAVIDLVSVDTAAEYLGCIGSQV
jgi:hypothetical protein